MSKKINILLTEHEKAHKLVIKKKYSNPKIYHGGKDYDTSKRWYVWYSYDHPTEKTKTGRPKRVRQLNIYLNVNQDYKHAEDRLEILNIVKDRLERLLEKGWSPYEDEHQIATYTAESALKFALENKKNVLKKDTYDGYKNIVNAFVRFLIKEGLRDANIESIKKRIVVKFLNEVLQRTSVSNRNRFKLVLGAIFKELETNDIIADNFTRKIGMLKAKPSKNKAYTPEQTKRIFDYSKEHYPKCYWYLAHIYYGLFRGIEVIRIRLQDIDLKNKVIHLETKTGMHYKQIPNYLFDNFYAKIDFSKYKGTDYLFTNKGHPGGWGISEKYRKSYFDRIFAHKIHPNFKLSKKHTTYSFRHAAAGKLFTEKMKELKEKNEPNFVEKSIDFVRSIMLHKDNYTTKMYLRDIGFFKIEDWSDMMTEDN